MTAGTWTETDYRVPGETVIATVPLGGRVGAMAVSPDGERVYVAQSGAVAVLDSGHRVVARIPLTGDPKELAINADGTRLIMVSYRGSVSVLDTSDFRLKTIAANWNSDVVVSPDRRCVYAAYNGVDDGISPSVISAIDVEGTLVATVPVVDDVRALTVSPGGSRLYAVSAEPSSYHQYPAGWLTSIDTASHAVIDTIQIGANPQAVTASPDGAHVYVTHDTAAVSAVDLTTKTISEIALDDTPFGVTFTPDGTHAYVTHLASVTAIDTVTHETERIVTGGQPQGVQLTPDGKRAYITNFGDHTVSVIDALTDSVTDTLAVDGHPEAMAMSPDGERLYVGDYWSGTITIIATPSVR